jgi:flagellar assembly protein FliH
VNDLESRENAVRRSAALRRLGDPTAVTTTYERRGHQTESLEAQRIATLRQAYAEGHAEGLEAATRDAARMKAEEADRLTVALGALAAAVEASHDAESRRWAEVQAAVGRLAFGVVEALVAHELRTASDPGREAIVRAMSTDHGLTPATVRLNPVDLDTLGQLGELGRTRELRVVADPSVESGGALVDLGKATIDAQVGTALERVRQVLLGSDASGAGHDRTA